MTQNRRLLWECVLLALLGFGAELLYSGFHRAFNLGNVTSALILVFVLPFAVCLGSHWFCDAKTLGRRLLYVACGAAGNVVGVWVVMTWF